MSVLLNVLAEMIVKFYKPLAEQLFYAFHAWNGLKHDRTQLLQWHIKTTGDDTSTPYFWHCYHDTGNAP